MSLGDEFYALRILYLGVELEDKRIDHNMECLLILEKKSLLFWEKDSIGGCADR